MSTPLKNNFVLSKDTTQAVFYNRNTDGAVVVIRVVNRGTEKARLVLAITNTQALPSDPAEYIEFGVSILGGEAFERTGIIIPPGFYLVAQSTKSNLSITCSGFATGTSNADIVINTASAAAITGNGLVYNYDPAHVLGLNTPTTLVLPDIEGNTSLTGASSPVYDAGTKSYSYNGVNQWFTSTDTILPLVGGLFADTGNPWSLEAWFKFPVTPSGTRVGNTAWTICGKGGGIGGAETFTLYVGSETDTTYQPVPFTCQIGIRGSKTQLSTGAVNDNTWRQVVITWDGAAGQVYRNGSSIGALNVGSAAQQFGTWTIGANGGATATFAYEGSIGPVRIYNRALTSGEVSTNWNYDRARFGL